MTTIADNTAVSIYYICKILTKYPVYIYTLKFEQNIIKSISNNTLGISQIVKNFNTRY